MDVSSKQIKKYVDTYNVRLENGLQFWAPYLINYNHTQDSSVPRGLGKSSPQEILASANYIVSQYPAIDSESLKRKLIDGSLSDMKMNYKGVDCSGFIFHVYSALSLDLLHRDLTEILCVPKNQVINGATNFEEWKDAHTLTEDEAHSLPELVPMNWVTATFKRKPASLCNVASLTSDYASTKVTDLSDVKIGDLVNMVIPGDTTKHIAAVIDRTPNAVTLAHSGRANPDDVGGVKIESVPISTSIETMQLSTAREFLGVYRLKGF